jgi:hypothetical protein
MIVAARIQTPPFTLFDIAMWQNYESGAGRM